MSYSRTLPPYSSRVRQQKPSAVHHTTQDESRDQTEAGSDNDHQWGTSHTPPAAVPLPSSASTTKHMRLKQVAEKEEADHNSYRATERQRLEDELRRQGPQRIGGPSLSSEELAERRRQQELDAKTSEKLESIRRKKRRDEYQQEQRRREQEEIDKKKQIQREKSERLEAQKALTKDAELQDLRSKRLAYLDKNSST